MKGKIKREQKGNGRKKAKNDKKQLWKHKSERGCKNLYYHNIHFIRYKEIYRDKKL